MEYAVETVPVDRVVVTPEGLLEPLCNTCCCPDCTNPIEARQVSRMGILKELRLYIVHEQLFRQVVKGTGYVGDLNEKKYKFDELGKKRSHG